MTAKQMKQKHWDDLYYLLITEDPDDRAEAVRKYGEQIVAQHAQHCIVKAAIAYRRRQGMNGVAS